MKKISCIYSILIGFCMLGMWSMLLSTGQVTEFDTEPYRIAAHLFSEFLTAALLIIGGITFLLKKAWGKALHSVSLGALLYSVFTAGGYYLQNGDIAMSIMFGCFIVLTTLFIAVQVFTGTNLIKERIGYERTI